VYLIPVPCPLPSDQYLVQLTLDSATSPNCVRFSDLPHTSADLINMYISQIPPVPIPDRLTHCSRSPPWPMPVKLATSSQPNMTHCHPSKKDAPFIASLKLSSNATIFNLDLLDADPKETLGPSVFGFKYKKVAKRTFLVSTTTPEEFQIIRRSPPDILASLRPLPAHPPPFQPGTRYTEERMKAQKIDLAGFLLPDKIALAHWILCKNEDGLAWGEEEKGTFSSEWFDPIKIPTIDHVPWVLKNIPLPPGIRNEVIQIIKAKIAAGTYEPSNSSYRSAWFCVLKKDRKSLRLVHNLQPLNAVTIRDASVPPNMDQMAEDFACCGCYGILDLFVAFDQRSLNNSSCNYTTFQTPLGTYRLTAIPMGYTNAAQVMQGDVSFILQDEIPNFTTPYIDDVPVKGPQMRYEQPDGSFKTIPDNPGVRRFVFKHLSTMHRILHHMKTFGGTFSGPKSLLCIPEIELVGNHCSYNGRIPDQLRVQAIVNWPACSSLTDVCSFLGTCGVMQVFIKDFAWIVQPLVRLTRKEAPFVWGPEQQESMDELKTAFATSHTLRPIDYHTELFDLFWSKTPI
jgi:hypothetical protein